MNRNVLLVLGPPGCGKSTQARKLSERHGWSYYSSNDFLNVRPQGKQTRSKSQSSQAWTVVEVLPRQIRKLDSLTVNSESSIALYLTGTTDEELCTKLSRKPELRVEAVERRLDKFEELTAAVILNSPSIRLVPIDARGRPELVAARIDAALAAVGVRLSKSFTIQDKRSTRDKT